MQILFVLFFPGNAEADGERGKKRNGCLMASCDRNM